MMDKLTQAARIAFDALAETGAARLVTVVDGQDSKPIAALLVVNEPDRARAIAKLCKQWDAEDEAMRKTCERVGVEA